MASGASAVAAPPPGLGTAQNPAPPSPGTVAASQRPAAPRLAAPPADPGGGPTSSAGANAANLRQS